MTRRLRVDADDGSPHTAALIECLVIQCDYDRLHSEFNLVTDWPLRPRVDTRAFAWFAFGGVTAFRRVRGTSRRLRHVVDRFSIIDDGGNPVVQAAIVKPIAQGISVRLFFGNLGWFEFVCSRIRYDSLAATWTTDGGLTRYFAVDDGREIVFEDPFDRWA